MMQQLAYQNQVFPKGSATLLYSIIPEGGVNVLVKKIHRQTATKNLLTDYTIIPQKRKI